MSWWETLLDSVPVVGTGYRTARAVTAHLTGDHEEAQQQWAEAGMNLAGDAIGVFTGGAGKVATAAAKAGAQAAAKASVKAVTKEGVKAISKTALKQAAKKVPRQPLEPQESS